MPTSHLNRRLIEHRGITVPTFLYGTAWKETRTETLAELALKSGFLGIDTANQRRHYYEAGVGQGIQRTLAENRIKRGDIFLQTKFTYAAGQDHRLPYDPNTSFASQVRQSFASSLEHLGSSYMDSLLLHGPMLRRGLTDADWEVWRTMEELHRSGVVKLIGVSNMEYDQLQLLLDNAEIKPAFLQNRCYARTKWDADIRELCRSNNVIYQGFSLLTANAAELHQPEIQQIAKRLGCSVARVVFRFALQVGMMPITGTTSEAHMKEDLAAYDIELSEKEIGIIEHIAY